MLNLIAILTFFGCLIAGGWVFWRKWRRWGVADGLVYGACGRPARELAGFGCECGRDVREWGICERHLRPLASRVIWVGVISAAIAIGCAIAYEVQPRYVVWRGSGSSAYFTFERISLSPQKSSDPVRLRVTLLSSHRKVPATMQPPFAASGTALNEETGLFSTLDVDEQGRATVYGPGGARILDSQPLTADAVRDWITSAMPEVEERDSLAVRTAMKMSHAFK